MNKEQVLRIVDSCFHMYASNYRAEAKAKADELYDLFITEKFNGDTVKLVKTCPECNSNNIFTFPDGIHGCFDCKNTWAIE